MSGDKFAASRVQVGDQSSFRQGDDYHGPVTIVNQQQYVRTPLHDAVAQNDESEVERLLSSGADINACDPGGYSPLNLAIWNGDDSMVKFLLNKGAPVENFTPTVPPLHAAIMNGNRNIAELLLDRGANKERRSGHLTPLALAASKGELQVVALLLERGAAVNARSMAGRTPLFGAVFSKSVDMVKLLLQHGAVPTEADYIGRLLTVVKNNEALASAFRTYGNKDMKDKLDASEREDVLRRIKASRYDVLNNPEDKDRALLFFAKLKREREVKVLLELGAHVSAQEYEKDAAWHAITGGNEKILQMVLDAGADVRHVYSPGKETLLHAAISHRSVSLVRILLDRGANVNAKDRNGYTPLHHAAIFSCKPIATLLLDHGADMSLKDNSGCTPLYRATVSRDEDMIRVLREKGAT